MTHFGDRGGNGKGVDLSGLRISLPKKKKYPSGVVVAPPPPPPPPPPATDTTPDAFTFIDVTNVSLNTLQISNAIVVTGMTGGASTASNVSGGEQRKNGGAWISSSVFVSNGDTLEVRHTSSGSNATPTNTTLNVGGVSDTFTSTTIAAVGIPIATGVARFLDAGDGSGVVITNPRLGDYLFIDPSLFAPSATSYDYQMYSDGVAIPGEAGPLADVAAVAFYVAEEYIGHVLSVRCHGINGIGISVGTNNSSGVAAVQDINLSGSAPSIVRSSASGISPITIVRSAFAANVKVGYGIQAQYSTSNTLDGNGDFVDADIVFDDFIVLDNAMLAAPNSIPFTAFDTSGYPQLFRHERIVATPSGSMPRFSPWCSLLQKSDSLTNTTAYTKYRIQVTFTGSGFYTLIGELKIRATPGGADTISATGVTVFGTTSADTSPATNVRDANPATYWSCNLAAPNSTAFPHAFVVDYSGGGATPIAANQFDIGCANGGSGGFPKNFTIDGWNGAAWILLTTRTGVVAPADGDFYTIVL